MAQAYGKTTFLITNLSKVLRGTEGAISLEGTLAGVGAAFGFSAVALALGQVSFSSSFSALSLHHSMEGTAAGVGAASGLSHSSRSGPGACSAQQALLCKFLVPDSRGNEPNIQARKSYIVAFCMTAPERVCRKGPLTRMKREITEALRGTRCVMPAGDCAGRRHSDSRSSLGQPVRKLPGGCIAGGQTLIDHTKSLRVRMPTAMRVDGAQNLHAWF